MAFLESMQAKYRMLAGAGDMTIDKQRENAETIDRKMEVAREYLKKGHSRIQAAQAAGINYQTMCRRLKRGGVE
jgi:hypothetical protein